MRLLPPEFEIDPKKPFANDLFELEPIAESLIRLLSQTEDSLVMTLDGPWGTGKSTFAKMLMAQLALEDKPFLTTSIDAFAIDYVDDPFIPITAKLAELVRQQSGSLDKADEFLKKASRVLLKILGKVVATGINVATYGALQSLIGSDKPDGMDKLGEKLADLTENLLEKKMRSYVEEEKTMQDFRDLLTELAQANFEKNGKPIIFFIDELDRCKPSFAVQFIERVKHFFAVPHLVFVLIVNKEQLERSIEATYGIGIDAHSYLQKFISLNINIQKPKNAKDSGKNFNKHIQQLVDWHKIEILKPYRNYDVFLKVIKNLIWGFDLTFRDVERVFAIFAIVLPVADDTEFYDRIELVFLLAIYKVKYPEYYEKLILNKQFSSSFLAFNGEDNQLVFKFGDNMQEATSYLDKVVKINISLWNQKKWEVFARKVESWFEFAKM